MSEMTARERSDLQSVAKMNGRVMKADVEAMVAARYSDFEAELARDWSTQELEVSEMIKMAERQIEAINDTIAEKCDELGIREALRPRMLSGLYASPRFSSDRQAELRRKAKAELDAAGKRAKVEIDRETARICSDIISRGLSSAEARGLLESVQTVDQLVPALHVKEIEAAGGGR